MRTRTTRVLCGLTVLALAGAPGVRAGEAAVDLATLTSAQASGGLKEALTNGISAAVASTGHAGGYYDNPLIKIVMPEKLQRVEKVMRSAGMGPKVDEFVHGMNAAAEQAAPLAKPILMNALKSMTIEDAKGIVAGGRTSGTDYFKRTSSTEVGDAFKPVVDKSMAKVGVTEQFQSLMASAPPIPFVKTPTIDINAYVLEKAVDGLFVVMGQEETKIRTNPGAQVTPLLKTVFGR
ncbi:DUF4197 domain-containing protein [Granulicella rosea]|nr:DUF4197 domain-containing protein [Granulicella rosea]